MRRANCNEGSPSSNADMVGALAFLLATDPHEHEASGEKRAKFPHLKAGYVKTQNRLDCRCAGWAPIGRRPPLEHVRLRQAHLHCGGTAIPAEPAAPPHGAR